MNIKILQSLLGLNHCPNCDQIKCLLHDRNNTTAPQQQSLLNGLHHSLTDNCDIFWLCKFYDEIAVLPVCEDLLDRLYQKLFTNWLP